MDAIYCNKIRLTAVTRYYHIYFIVLAGKSIFRNAGMAVLGNSDLLDH